MVSKNSNNNRSARRSSRESPIVLSPKYFAICILRSQCSGGVTFARKLADRLGVPLYDDNLFDYSSRDHNIRRDLFVRNEDSTDFSVPIFYGTDYTSGSMITYTDNFLSNKNIYSMQAETIRRLASRGSAIFLGHTSDFTLRDHPNLLTLYISEPMEVRIRNLQADYEGVDDEEARDRLLKLDKDRRQYYNYYTGMRWGRCESYDLALRPSFFGIDYAVDLVIEVIRKKGFPLGGESASDHEGVKAP